jgi:hypothetical protein
VTNDIALTEDDDRAGGVIAHRIDCPVVQIHREAGRVIMTMLGCKHPLAGEIKRHHCLEEGSA